jgi:hypothetical protein
MPRAAIGVAVDALNEAASSRLSFRLLCASRWELYDG